MFISEVSVGIGSNILLRPVKSVKLVKLREFSPITFY